MDELLTTLGEGRAFCLIYSHAYEPVPSTRSRYLDEYRRYRAGVMPEGAPTVATALWAMNGIRFGAIEGLKAAVPALEQALAAGDAEAAAAAAVEVRACVDVFAKYPPTPLGRRIRPIQRRQKEEVTA